MQRRALFVLSLLAASGTVMAQAYPNKVVKLQVPFAPGGTTDIVARVIADPLGRILGQSVIVENKAGGGGLIGAKAAAQSAPDGLTLAYIHSGLVTVQAMTGRIDILKEFKPVARLSNSPFVVVVSADSKFKTLKDLITAVQANPGKYSYGSGGPGSPAHLAVEYLEEKLGNFKALHVPFKGASEAANALIGGQVDFQIGLLGAVIGQVQGGRLRALAATSATRLPALPEVPTMAEAGVPGFVFAPWGGLAVPAGTPDAVVARLNELLPGVMNSAPMKDLMGKQGSVVDYAPAAALAAQIAREVEVDKVVVKRLGMTQ
jgi:tripartite-type tricarboxylate transporter receptor subunit TctC